MVQVHELGIIVACLTWGVIPTPCSWATYKNGQSFLDDFISCPKQLLVMASCLLQPLSLDV